METHLQGRVSMELPSPSVTPSSPICGEKTLDSTNQLRSRDSKHSGNFENGY